MEKSLTTKTYNLKPNTFPLIVIVGQTASGKSSLALKLAKKFGGEVITADSWTVYKGFDIGTAKPTLKQQQAITHHLLDVADPAKGFSAVEFKKRAEKAIKDISEKRELPILVGGSGLYIDSVLYDYQFLPAGPAKDRAFFNLLSLKELQNMVESSGFDTENIDTHNKRRLIRLLETDGQKPKKSTFRKNTLVLGLKISQEQLKKRIEKRVDQMLNLGLQKEVSTLSKKYGWEAEPMKGIGYREWREYFAGRQTLEQTRNRIISASSRLAKKQRTWFKRNKSIQWIDNSRTAVDIVTTFLNKNSNTK